MVVSKSYKLESPSSYMVVEQGIACSTIPRSGSRDLVSPSIAPKQRMHRPVACATSSVELQMMASGGSFPLICLVTTFRSSEFSKYKYCIDYKMLSMQCNDRCPVYLLPSQHIFIRNSLFLRC
jgi:hypothetical protein